MSNSKAPGMISSESWHSWQIESCKDRIYSTKSDIFAYGVVLYEIAAQEEPWKGFTGGKEYINM